MPGTADDEFGLLAGSPGIDQGIAIGVTNDLVGNFRPAVGRIGGSAIPDMGAYEFAFPNPGRPVIDSGPSDQTVIAGGGVNFSISVSGAAPFGYQWYRNGTLLSGQTGETLQLGPVLAGDAGGYHVAVSNAEGTATSRTASLVVNVPPAIVRQPVSAIVNAGGNVTFVVVATGDGRNYQWQKDGADIAGQTGSTLNLSLIGPGDAGFYRVVVTSP